MNLPILEKLKEGTKFDFDTLACNVEQTDEFWIWWWAEKAQAGVIARPEIIEDSDPILTLTALKPTVDSGHYTDFFDRILLNAVRQGRLPSGNEHPREQFQTLALQMVASSSAKLPGQPQIVFSGGGYGSGKSTILNYLAESGTIDLKLAHLVGVDVFKPLIPEYNLIKAVADGRASLTVQKECMELASGLFEVLVECGRSFAWDSSMSDEQATLKRIQLAKQHGYALTLIAVLTPLDVAIRQGMNRAKYSRRFPHPKALPESHVGFRKSFQAYVPLFERVMVFGNQGEPHEAICVAQKLSGKTLAIHDEDLLSSLLNLPMS